MRALRSLIVVALVGLASIAQAGMLTDFAQNKAIDALIRGQALGAPSTWYAAAYTTCPTDAGGGVEVSGGSYARVAITASLTNWAGTQAAGSTTASSGATGQTSNNIVITLPAPTANWGVLNCLGLLDAPTDGNLWIYTPLNIPKTVNNGDAAPAVSAGSWTLTIGN